MAHDQTLNTKPLKANENADKRKVASAKRKEKERRAVIGRRM